MKISRYNILIPHNKAIFIYNTLWNTLLVIKEEDKKKWGIEDIIKHNLPTINEERINVFEKKKIIIPDNVDEISIVKNKLMHTIQDDTKFSMIIIPTLSCNFRCWYCYENHEHKKMMDEVDIKKIIELTKKIIHSNKRIEVFDLQFFGGEPMLGFNKVIKPILVSIKSILDENKIKMTVGLTTNGYLFNKEKIIFLRKHNLENLQITLDGNKKRHNNVRYSYRGENTFDIIINNIKLAISNEVIVTVRLNISEETNLNVNEFLDPFRCINYENRKKLFFSIQKVWQAPEYLEDKIIHIVEEIRNNGFMCASYYSSPSSIWNTCYSDKQNQITINPEGKIYKCTARDFDKQDIEGVLKENGDVEWEKRYYKRMLVSPLDNKECQECSIFPICIGGCSQKRIESSNNAKCILSKTSEDKIIYAKKVLAEKIYIKKMNFV